MSTTSQFINLQQILRPLEIYSLSGDTLVDIELKAYAEGLNILQQELETLEKEAFISTASSYGLALRESLTGRVKDLVDVESRRDMLLYRSSITSNDFTKEDIENALISCGIDAQISENFDGNSIYVSCSALMDEFNSQEDVIKTAMEFLPAHLQINFDFRSFCWDDIDSNELTFDEMDSKNMNWNEIEEYGKVI